MYSVNTQSLYDCVPLIEIDFKLLCIVLIQQEYSVFMGITLNLFRVYLADV